MLETRCNELDTTALEARYGTGLRFRELCDEESELRRRTCALGTARDAAHAAYDQARRDAEQLERDHSGAFATVPGRRQYNAHDENSVSIRARAGVLGDGFEDAR